MSSRFTLLILAGVLLFTFHSTAAAQTNSPDKPTWWAKYQYLVANGPATCTGQPGFQVGPNVDVSNECGPQSETYVTINPARPSTLAAGSNEIFRLPMRGGLASFGGVSHPIWTDSRNQLDPLAGCRTGLAMEEVFSATVSKKR
jgi:hypothetical protein